ncbi:MAG: ABC transporter ATP-binding protein [bacterium]
MNEANRNIIEVYDLSMVLGKVEILKGISLTVHEGEYLSVIGPNGSGKTTLIKCLDRIHRISGGRICLDHVPLHAYTQREIARRMGYVPQTPGDTSLFSVYEFVLMGRYPSLNPFSPPTRRDREAVFEALRLTSTDGLAHRVVSTLSGGERQKVFIAAALSQRPGILLLDEPTTFLDPRHQDDIQEMLLRINRKSGVTIIAATHDINSALRASTRIIALKGGEVAFCGSPDELMEQGLLDAIYEKRFTFLKHPGTGRPVAV